MILVERSGSEDLRGMGGMALRAPVLAAFFLIVTLAMLAMPGSSNFVGEFFILNGLFQEKIVFALLASAASRCPPTTPCASTSARCTTASPTGIDSREIGLAGGPVSAARPCILGLALYPS